MVINTRHLRWRYRARDLGWIPEAMTTIRRDWAAPRSADERPALFARSAIDFYRRAR